ncbi:uncharacterized protein LOC120641625 isoform X1 [Panicum virgatum]|uniref:uncharacterized protein LOC120641625 isoform X1 n=1 Tax=Panicum virgatum TaxID=38727 RepID=UPI0019D54689|nr:uncharacterized protein LOC120641625 isoform X1 [Panicum virgatum]XP_039773746.1 uncharacterized protein LOC120641625 isoform X1 [Panicum virgatum]
MANRSYLKSQKLKATEADRRKVALLEAENATLKKDKAALEQRVRMLKDVIQKNRGSTEEHQKELQELRVAARTVVESVDSADESDGSLADQLQKVPQKFAEYLAEASRNCVAQALGLVKSYWSWAKIGVLGDGLCSTCDHDQFAKYVEEAEPVADQIVKLIEQ